MIEQVGWFVGDAGSPAGPNGETLCACAHRTNNKCLWPNGSRAIVNCSLDYWANTPDKIISHVVGENPRYGLVGNSQQVDGIMLYIHTSCE